MASKVTIVPADKLPEMQMLELEAAFEKAKRLVDQYTVELAKAEGAYSISAKEHVVGREVAWRMQGIAEQLQIARLMMSALLVDLDAQLGEQRQIRSQEEQS